MSHRLEEEFGTSIRCQGFSPDRLAWNTSKATRQAKHMCARPRACLGLQFASVQLYGYLESVYSVQLTRCLAAETFNLGVARKTGSNVIQQEM